MKTSKSRNGPLPSSTNVDPVRAAFLRRSMDTIFRIAAQADRKILTDALSASTGAGTLARVLADPGAVGPSVIDLDPLAPLVARNTQHRAEMLAAAGGTLSSIEVAGQIGISRQAVEKRRRANALLAVRVGSDWRYPHCQFGDSTGEVVSGLPQLLGALGQSNPWIVLDFLLSADETLGNATPLEVLRREGLSPALERLARIEQGDGFA
jgi:hypothetical protein